MKTFKRQMSDEERAELEARSRLLERLERHEKTHGDTAKMRARMGLEPGEIPPEAWKMGEKHVGGAFDKRTPRGHQ